MDYDKAQANLGVGTASAGGNVTERNNSMEHASPIKWESMVFADACKTSHNYKIMRMVVLKLLNRQNEKKHTKKKKRQKEGIDVM